MDNLKFSTRKYSAMKVKSSHINTHECRINFTKYANENPKNILRIR